MPEREAETVEIERSDWLKRFYDDAEYSGGVRPEYDPDSMAVLRFDGEPAACARCGFYIADERVEGPVPAAAFDYGSGGVLCERCMSERDAPGEQPYHGGHDRGHTADR